MTEINYWLMKSEPSAYSIEQLQIDKVTLWDGIRNFQARNYMRSMAIGDQAFFYHSNCKPPAIVGLMEVQKTHIIDPTQFDPQSKYYDPKSSRESPKWDCTKMIYLKQFARHISLGELKEIYAIDQLKLLQKGNRLSIMPIPKGIAKDLLHRLSKK